MILSEIKTNPPWVNICWGIFLPLIIFTIFGLIFEGWYAIFIPLSPVMLMTLGTFLLFDYPVSRVPEVFDEILIAKVLLGLAVIWLIIGYRFKIKIWGQTLIVMGFWLWNGIGLFGLGLHG